MMAIKTKVTHVRSQRISGKAVGRRCLGQLKKTHHEGTREKYYSVENTKTFITMYSILSFDDNKCLYKGHGRKTAMLRWRDL